LREEGREGREGRGGGGEGDGAEGGEEVGEKAEEEVGVGVFVSQEIHDDVARLLIEQWGAVEKEFEVWALNKP
jgi:hypothetical protein